MNDDIFKAAELLATKIREEQLEAAIAILEKLSLENGVTVEQHDKYVELLRSGKGVMILPHSLWGGVDKTQYMLLERNHYFILAPSNSIAPNQVIITERPENSSNGRIQTKKDS